MYNINENRGLKGDKADSNWNNTIFKKYKLKVVQQLYMQLFISKIYL